MILQGPLQCACRRVVRKEDKMQVDVKILGLSATPIKDGNCDKLMKEALQAARGCGGETGKVETEFLTLADKEITLCKHCQWCIENRKPCSKIHDDVNAVWEKITSCDGLIIGSPAWTLTLCPLYSILNSRARYYVFFTQKLRNKVVGFFTLGYLGLGFETALDQLYHMTGGGQIMIPVARAWAYSSTAAFGQRPEYLEHGVMDDKAGLQRIRNAAVRVVEVSRMVKYAAQSGISLPDKEMSTITGAHLTKKRVFKDGVWIAE